MKKFVFGAMVFLAGGALASGWNLNVGYSWRAKAKTSFSGGAPAAPGEYSTGSISADGKTWSGEIDELPVRSSGIDTGTKTAGVADYALRINRSEGVVASGSDEDCAHGLTASIGYDFGDGPVALGLNLRFAGYWGVKNGTRGGYCEYNDYYRFDNVLGDAPDPTRDSVNPNLADGRREYIAGGALGGMRTELKSDLYQIAFGPKVTWHVASWLDIYGGAEALCTFANSELSAGGAKTDEVNCLWGAGGYVGLTGWLAENVGIYGQVGYEWIDEDDVSVQGIRASTDYSSLVLSAGIQVRF